METLVQGRRALYKSGPTPPWKETYRQRCVERLKNSRARLLDRYRRVGENETCRAGSALLVQEVMEVEWQALLTTDVKLPSLRKKDSLHQVLEDSEELAVLEEIQKELMLQEQLAIQEYEQSLRFDEECLSAMLDGLDAERIICPVCIRNNLTVKSDLIVCPCGLCMRTQMVTEEKLRFLLEERVTEHSHHCLHNPEFAVTNGMGEEASLLMSCQVCDYWAIVL